MHNRAWQRNGRVPFFEMSASVCSLDGLRLRGKLTAKSCSFRCDVCCMGMFKVIACDIPLEVPEWISYNLGDRPRALPQPSSCSLPERDLRAGNTIGMSQFYPPPYRAGTSWVCSIKKERSLLSTRRTVLTVIGFASSWWVSSHSCLLDNSWCPWE